MVEENHNNLLQKIGIGLGLIFGVLTVLFIIYQIGLKCIYLLIIKLLTSTSRPKQKSAKREQKNTEETLKLTPKSDESKGKQIWVS